MKLDSRLSLLVLLATTAILSAQERDVSKWIEIPYPKDLNSKEGSLWLYRAEQSTNVWRVFRDGQKVCAALPSQTNLATRAVPEFTPEAESFHRPSATLKVLDGWLVGFNRGEWGGALYWFSPDGTAKYKISKNPIVDFVQIKGRNLAIVDGGYMSFTSDRVGLIISISQSANQGPWQVTTMCRLPQGPRAVGQHPNGSLLVILDNSFVSATLDGNIKTIVKEGRWGTLSPGSVVLSDDTKTAYVGLRQFVAKVTLKNGRVSFLVPDRSFLNQLPKEL